MTPEPLICHLHELVVSQSRLIRRTRQEDIQFRDTRKLDPDQGRLIITSQRMHEGGGTNGRKVQMFLKIEKKREYLNGKSNM